MSLRNLFFVFIAGILWSCVLGLQRPPPRYSQQFMPETSFTCRNKIVGSYYADPEADCQLFHVCVSVAGLIQDYKFLCPNDTAFDQESQTCANWYDVDCEAATLYYASDNFDLYRIGSGLESLHYDSFRSDAEPQDHLQRSETNDPVRSAANNYNRVAQNTYNSQSSSSSSSSNNNNKGDILRGSSSSNFYNSRNNGKEEDYDNDKSYRDEPVVEAKKKPGVRKVARKQQFHNNINNINNGNNNSPSSTAAPVSSTSQNYNSNSNYNGNYNNNYYNNYNSRRNNHEATTTVRPTEDYNKQSNVKHNIQTSTYRPPSTPQQTYSTHQASSTTAKTTTLNNNNYNNNFNGNQKSNTYGLNAPTTVKPITYSQNLQHSPSTARPTSYSQNYQDNYSNQYTQFNQNSRTPSTTVAPSTNYQQTDYTNFQPRNYNNIQRSTPTAAFSSTTATSTFVDNYRNNNNNNNNNNNQFNGKTSGITSSRQSTSQTTKFYPNYSANNFAPTTYAPLLVKKTNNDNNGQYYDSNTQPPKSTQYYYDSTKPSKKVTQYNNYDNNNSGKYFEASTVNYDFVRSQGIGFSPSSINLLAETPKTTTPVPRRTAAPTTYNPNNFNSRGSQQYTTTPRLSNSSARPFSTTAAFADATTPKPKSTKKNDYDYAYYDNVGALEYDGLDLENVARNKESSKISRN